MAEVRRGYLVELGTNVTAPSTTVFEEGHEGVDVSSTPLAPHNPRRSRLHDFDISPLVLARRQRSDHRSQRSLALMRQTRRRGNVFGGQTEDALGHLDGVIDVLLEDIRARRHAGGAGHSSDGHFGLLSDGLGLAGWRWLLLSPSSLRRVSVESRSRWLWGRLLVEAGTRLRWLLLESGAALVGGGRAGDVVGVGSEHARLSGHRSGRLRLRIVLKWCATELLRRPGGRRPISTTQIHAAHGLIQRSTLLRIRRRGPLLRLTRCCWRRHHWASRSRRHSSHLLRRRTRRPSHLWGSGRHSSHQPSSSHWGRDARCRRHGSRIGRSSGRGWRSSSDKT
mmetsp:Transcript_34476/g.74525  ORF Transcript_34476/g.74525 Transcript_34476/m.74525 type:complete len:337 (-) Transcript_34476:728-1738(-)